MSPRLGTLASVKADPWLSELGVGTWMDDVPAEEFPAACERLFEETAERLQSDHYIHPTAYVSDRANVPDRLIIGPGATVHEFSTVRERTILSRDVHVGYGCEISRTVILHNSALVHRVSLAIAMVGSHCHLSAGVAAYNTGLWNPDPLNPTRPLRIQLHDGTVAETGRTKVGALFGDRVRCGANATAGPAALIGADTILYPNVTVGSEEIPGTSVVRIPNVPLLIEPRRDLPTSPTLRTTRLEGVPVS